MVFTGKLIEEAATPTQAAAETSQTTPPPPAQAPKPAKKSHKFRNFILYTLGLTTIAYGGAVYYSLDDDTFRDLFTENVPFAEDVVYFIEEQRFKRKFSSVLPSIASAPTSDGSAVSTITSSKTTVTQSRSSAGASATWKPPVDHPDVAPGAASILKSGKKSKAAPAPAPVAVAEVPKEVTSATSTASKPTSPSAPSVPTPATTPSLPLISVPAGADPAVTKSIESLNAFIQVVNQAKASPSDVDAISAELHSLSAAIESIKATTVTEAKKLAASDIAKSEHLLESSINELKTAVSAQEEKWAREFHDETKRLAHAYNERLQNEVNAANKVIFAHANNQLLAVHAAREREFAKQIVEHVDSERDGRLANLKELASEVASVQALVSKADKAVEDADRAAKLQFAVTKLRVALNADEPVPLAPYFSVLTSLTDNTKDEFLSAVLAAVPQDALEQGVLSPAQLAARFHLLEPEIRKASLLPPNAGVAGHFGSVVFSKLLWKKSGSPLGDDVEAILARANTALSEGRTTDAVAEVNTLKGWPKRLASDWLAEGRKRSEVEFISDLLVEEGKLWL